MDARHLELLRELAERGSVVAVARATHRTPSAVSQQLKTAQRDFGLPLVEPAGRGIRLTAAGALLAEGGREVAATLARVQATFDEFRDEPAGTVRIASFPSGATFLLPPVLADLAGTRIEVEITDIDVAEAAYADLVADHDVVIAHALTRRPADDSDRFITRHLAREPLDVVMSVDHPLTAGASVTADDLADWPWIGVPVGFPFDSVRLAVEEATGRTVRMVQRVRDNLLTEALVAGSDRIAVLPRFTSPLGAGVVLRPIAGIEAARHVFAVLRPDRAERLVVRRVLGCLERAAAAAKS